jgi:hypothetical protein
VIDRGSAGDADLGGGALPTISIEETILGRAPALDDETESYHEASRAYPGIIDPTVRGARLLESSEEMRASTTRSTKRYSHAPILDLPSPSLGAATLADALAARRSARSYGVAPLTLQQLSAQPRRPGPSTRSSCTSPPNASTGSMSPSSTTTPCDTSWSSCARWTAPSSAD